MLRLYIDGSPVNLSEEVATELYEKNPFFTNEGKSSLDIDINLNDPQNARIFDFIHRIERHRRTVSRVATLQDETGVLIRGEAVVLDVEDMRVKIQIVEGTSELNYMMGDLTLQELDLWCDFTSEEVVYFPVCAFNNTKHAEFDLMDSIQIETESDGSRVLRYRIINKPTWAANGSLIPSNEVGQPYIWAIVRRVVGALGFDIGESVLETDNRYNKMVMVHAIRSRYIADILPRWTVKKFFDEIQKLFNVIIDADGASHSVSILHGYDYLDENIVELPHEDIISVEKNYDGDESGLTMVDYDNVHYNLTDKASNKYLDIDPALTEVCTIIPEDDSNPNRAWDLRYYAGIWKAIVGSNAFYNQSTPNGAVENIFGKRNIYTAMFDGEERKFVLWAMEDRYTALRMIDQFGRKSTDGSSGSGIELDIVPVRMVSSPIVGNSSRMWQFPMPAVDGEYSGYGEIRWGNNIQHTENETDLNEEIKSGFKGVEAAGSRSDVMFAAFYLGNINVASYEDPLFLPPAGVVVPLAAPDYHVQLQKPSGLDLPGGDEYWRCGRQVLLGSDYLTMAINGPHGMDAYSYSRNPSIDTSTSYTIRFRDWARRLDVRRVWLISNHRFLCKELKYKVESGRRSDVVEGVFYPVTETGENAAGQVVCSVTYSLSHVIVERRVRKVINGESLDVELKLESGGSASSALVCFVTMGGNDITATAFSHGATQRTGTVHISAVTGDVHITAYR